MFVMSWTRTRTTLPPWARATVSTDMEKGDRSRERRKKKAGMNQAQCMLSMLTHPAMDHGQNSFPTRSKEISVNSSECCRHPHLPASIHTHTHAPPLLPPPLSSLRAQEGGQRRRERVNKHHYTLHTPTYSSFVQVLLCAVFAVLQCVELLLHSCSIASSAVCVCVCVCPIGMGMVRRPVTSARLLCTMSRDMAIAPHTDQAAGAVLLLHTLLSFLPSSHPPILPSSLPWSLPVLDCRHASLCIPCSFCSFPPPPPRLIPVPTPPPPSQKEGKKKERIPITQ